MRSLVKKISVYIGLALLAGCQPNQQLHKSHVVEKNAVQVLDKDFLLLKDKIIIEANKELKTALAVHGIKSKDKIDSNNLKIVHLDQDDYYLETEIITGKNETLTVYFAMKTDAQKTSFKYLRAGCIQHGMNMDYILYSDVRAYVIAKQKYLNNKVKMHDLSNVVYISKGTKENEIIWSQVVKGKLEKHSVMVCPSQFGGTNIFVRIK